VDLSTWATWATWLFKKSPNLCEAMTFRDHHGEPVLSAVTGAIFTTLALGCDVREKSLHGPLGLK